VYDVRIITGNELRFFPGNDNFVIRKILKVFALVASHIGLGRKILESKDADALILYGFSTEFLFLTFLSSLWTKNVYLLIHHNIQQARQNSFMKFMLKIYHHLKYKFIVNETSSVLQDLGYKEAEIYQHLSLPHPVIKVNDTSDSNLFNNDESKKKKVGIVGKIRKGKKFSDSLSLLMKISKELNIVLVIGTDDFSYFNDTILQDVKLIDTSNNDSYLTALSSCDVAVLNYEESKYFYRCSGVAADAISVQTYVVCPDFPLMSSQVNYPTQVGVLYKNEVELESALHQALELTVNSDRAVFESHYAERSPAKFASILDQAIKARV
jgi:hypothetical protein